MLFLLAIAQTPTTITLTQGLAFSTPGNRRSAIRLDPTEFKIVNGTWSPPREGDKIGSATVAKVTANKDGYFEGPAQRGDYICFNVACPAATTMLLNAVGNSVVYVNGEPRVGDAYGFGYATIPVALKAGDNELLFATGRGRFKAILTSPKKPLEFSTGDLTLPEIVTGDKGEFLAAVPVMNSSSVVMKGLAIRAETEAGSVVSPLGPIQEATTRKVGFRFKVPKDEHVRIQLIDARRQVLDETVLTLRRRKPGEPFKRTFLSEIDGSVQYYGVNPSRRPGPNQALFLTLHGASVEGIGQTEAYSPKDWGYLIAPTNRRPYGFDWEDVGRLDALEVLADAQTRFKTDPARTYLTGHSMGGHGTWQIGAHFPDKFAAIAPSAGWSSFFSYGGGVRYSDPTPVQQMLQRAGNPSDTLLLKYNYKQQAVYVLHGDADDNVPVTEARNMRAALATFHKDIDFWEQPGANHWWDVSPEAGADCVDWAPIFDLFGRRRLPSDAEVKNLDFTTISPGINSVCHWATVLQQTKPFVPSRIQLKLDPILQKISGITENVDALELAIPTRFADKWKVEIDGTTLDGTGRTITLRKIAGRWTATSLHAESEKSPQRSGGFKSILNRKVVFVYGTQGTAEENAWAKAKAKYDAETFWYRGNGSVDIIADRDAIASNLKDRNLLLYGNANTNLAWNRFASASDFRVESGKVSVGERVISRDDAAVFAILPRKDSVTGCVALIGGTGIKAMRLCNRGPIFTSGAAYPDVLILEPESLVKGTEGVIVAGFFGNDWSVKNGEFAWRP